MSTRHAKIATCCAIALLAPFLGGTTEASTQGIIMILVALLVGFSPPRSYGSRVFAISALLLLVISATAFLPAAWFGNPVWRQSLSGLGITISSSISSQPYISGGCIVLLLTGMLWIFWLVSQPWDAQERQMLAGCFVMGAAVIGLVAIVSYYCKMPVPIWHSERGFGPFPNRNQSGNFFAISGILALGCFYENVRHHRGKGFGFLLAAALLGWALVLSYSRAAVALFLVGALLWVVSLRLVSHSPKPIAVAASLLITLAAAFLFFGGATLQRFQGGDGVTLGFRWLIYKDAFALIRSSPWCGIGLGNFEGVFALFRKESVMTSRILHPESDWIWLWAEMGFLAVALVLAGSGVLFKHIFPLRHGTARGLRLAAGAAALVMVLHGAVDVSGHRLGSMLPGLLMLGIAAWNPGEKRNVGAAVCFRVAAGVVAICGGALLYQAAQKSVVLPGETGAEKLKNQALALIARKEPVAAAACATTALAYSPLDWQLYFVRGRARADEGNWPRAFDDFRRVNLLEPTSPLVTFEEGRIWLMSQPALAVPAWRETLRRLPPRDATQWYSQMLDYSAPMPGLRTMLARLARGNFDLELVYLACLPPDEMKLRIQRILESDPDLKKLSDRQKTGLAEVWAAHGGGDEMVRQFWMHPAWQPFAWRQTAGILATAGNIKGACDVAFQFMPKPLFPAIASTTDVEALHKRLLTVPDDAAAGFALYSTLNAQKNDGAALEVIRSFTSQAGCPVYFHFLEADVQYRLGNHDAAWNALQKYEAPGLPR